MVISQAIALIFLVFNLNPRSDRPLDHKSSFSPPVPPLSRQG
ncbi:hypothetical protein [Okeania sp. KiyG1]|nr:hypothetical protein [Okeania sp. KiyG1]